MSNEITTTAVTEIVNSEVIDQLIMDYTIDATVIAPLAYTMDISNQATIKAAMAVWVKDAGGDITTEGTTDMSNTLLETTEATATAAQVGILREVADLAASSSILGEDGLRMFIARDGALLMAEMLEDDLAALFASISNSVGSSESDLTIANCVQAQMTRRTLNARGPAAFVLDDQQLYDLSAAVVGSTATVFEAGANQSILNGRSDGFAGTFLGDPVYYTNLTDTANTGSNVVGAYITTNGNPYHASLGIAMKWFPRMKSEIDVSKVTTQYAITQAHGVTLRYNTTAVKIVTDA
jgi:hypothetical protein